MLPWRGERRGPERLKTGADVLTVAPSGWGLLPGYASDAPHDQPTYQLGLSTCLLSSRPRHPPLRSPIPPSGHVYPHAGPASPRRATNSNFIKSFKFHNPVTSPDI